MIMPESPLWQWHKTEPKTKNRACQAGRAFSHLASPVCGVQSQQPESPMLCHAMPCHAREIYMRRGNILFYAPHSIFDVRRWLGWQSERGPAPAHSISAQPRQHTTHWPRVHLLPLPSFVRTKSNRRFTVYSSV